MMVRDFQSVIGRETRRQMLRKEGRLPDALVACVGGGSNAAGMFYPFVEDKSVRLIGVEAAGLGLDSGLHAATLMKGAVGVLHGSRSYVLQDARGPDAAGAQRLGRAGLSRRRPRAQPTGRKPAASRTPRPRTRRRWTRSGCSRGWRASSPRWNRRTPSRTPSTSRRKHEAGRDPRRSASPAAATKTASKWRKNSDRSYNAVNHQGAKSTKERRTEDSKAPICRSLVTLVFLVVKVMRKVRM